MLSALYHSLSLQMLVAILLGTFTGLFLGDLCTVFGPWESAYIRILKITTVPYLVCAVMYGIGRLVSASAKQIFQKGLLFITCTWAINIGVIYLSVYLFPKSEGLSRAIYTNSPPAPINFAELLIPDNIFSSLANNSIPAVAMFALLVGLGLMHLREKQVLMSILDTLVEVLTRITGWISRITPIGTFLIIADRVGTVQPTTIKQISTYLILYILCICLLVFWIFPRIVGMFTSISSTQWVKDLSPILLLAFTTNVVIVTLPFMIELIKKESEKYYRKDLQLQDQVQGIVSIIFNLPLGSLFITVFVFFTSIFYHMPLSNSAQIQLFLTTFLTSLGAVGLGSWINSLKFLLDSLGLPLSAIETYLTTLPFTAGFQSLVSVMEISSLSLLIALTCHGFLQWKWKTVIFKSILTIIPVIAFGFVFKNWVKLPPICNPTKTITNLVIKSPVKVKIYQKDDRPTPRQGNALDRILESKILRVGYNLESTPFAFFNDDKALIGHDIVLAHVLAKDLGCDLEFVPIQLHQFSKELNEGLYDIVMSGLSVTESRLKTVCFTNPYLETGVGFIMRKKFKHLYTSIETILKNPSVKLIVRNGSSYETLAHKIAPADKIITVNSYDEYVQLYPEHILLRGQPQAISWIADLPKFTIVTPEFPNIKDTFAYAIAKDQDSLLCYLDQWIHLKKNENLFKEQYTIWILGQTDNNASQERRWSILRNVLGWTHN